MKKYFIYILCLLFLYLYFHNPVLNATGGVGTLKLLYPICLLFFIMNNKSCNSCFRTFKKELSIALGMMLYLILVSLFAGNVEGAYARVVAIVEDFLVPIVLTAMLFKCNIDYKELIRMSLIISAFASVVSLLCVSIPSFGSYVRFELLVTPDDSYLGENLHRGFGISDSLTSSYGYIQGACLAIGFNYIKENKWYIFFMPFVFFSAILNARTGIIIAAFGIIISLVCQKRLSSVFAIGAIAIFSIVIIPYVLNWMNLSDQSLLFITDFFDQFVSMQESGSIDDTTAGTLLGRMLVWPDNISQWIFGRGESIFVNANGASSDVGFILQLNYGGIIYLILLVRWLFFMVNRLYNNGASSFDVWNFIMIALVINIKTDYWGNTGMLRMMLLLYYMFVFERIKESESVNMT